MAVMTLLHYMFSWVTEPLLAISLLSVSSMPVIPLQHSCKGEVFSPDTTDGIYASSQFISSWDHHDHSASGCSLFVCLCEHTYKFEQAGSALDFVVLHYRLRDVNLYSE